MQNTVRKTAPLMCGALLASIVTIAEPAQAEPGLIHLQSWTQTATVPQFSLFSGDHQFGGTSTHGNAPYTITIDSYMSQRPGWQYELRVNYTAYDPGYFSPTARQHLVLDIKPPTAPDPITAFQIKHSNGSLFTSSTSTLENNGGTLHVNVSIGDLMSTGDNIMIVQWNQIVPAPGALALLGLAGVVGGRRRRTE